MRRGRRLGPSAHLSRKSDGPALSYVLIGPPRAGPLDPLQSELLHRPQRMREEAEVCRAVQVAAAPLSSH